MLLFLVIFSKSNQGFRVPRTGVGEDIHPPTNAWLSVIHKIQAPFRWCFIYSGWWCCCCCCSHHTTRARTASVYSAGKLTDIWKSSVRPALLLLLRTQTEEEEIKVQAFQNNLPNGLAQLRRRPLIPSRTFYALLHYDVEDHR